MSVAVGLWLLLTLPAAWASDCADLGGAPVDSALLESTGCPSDEGSTWVNDADLDGFPDGDAACCCPDDASLCATLPPDDYNYEWTEDFNTTDQWDCDDADPQVNPDAREHCNQVDDDCDGIVESTGPRWWYLDSDEDGYGDTRSFFQCKDTTTGRESYSVDGDDCDDTDSSIWPEAEDPTCDEVDQDCDGQDDYDGDGDGWACEGYTDKLPGGTGEGDCDDDDIAVNPDAEEVWYDGVDQDCDGGSDDDQDGDGYDSVEQGGNDCWDNASATPTAYSVIVGTDADGVPLAWDQPAADEVYPGAVDAPYDGVDQDCAGDDEHDLDEDGWETDLYPQRDGTLGLDCDDDDDTVNPDATETWYDGVDQDCDGTDADQDGDGHDAEDQGGYDCDDTDAAVSPDAAETWYDGTDQDCDGASDDDQDGDTYDSDAHGGTDCDDTDPGVHPGSTETWYDGLDADCDGADDADQDADGHRAEASGGDDCDDTSAEAYPGQDEVWYDGTDNDCDGESDYDQDLDGFDGDAYDGQDCDDLDPDVGPDAPEVWYDGVDQDCDGESDDDQDRDGHDSDAYGGDDCNDTDPDTSPEAAETWYDGVDQDCDGESDDDQDGDGYDSDAYGGDDCDDTDAGVSPGQSEIWYDGVDQDCDGNDGDADGDGSDGIADCDDDDPTVYPGATEIWYDGVDQDCDGESDDDQDADGYDSDAHGGTDCDDEDPAVNPGESENFYDGVDQDCDGESDDDQDGDGYDSDAHGGDDCDDGDVGVNPGVEETWYDGVDQDCDGAGDYDQDADGDDAADQGGQDCDDEDPTVSSDAAEIWYDGVDQDCDGASDLDQDGDGRDAEPYGGDDCDDENPAVSTSVEEVWYDGLDQDCDGADDYDQDGDGDRSADWGGSDCDDAREDVYGAADEIWYDGVDQDCDDNDGDQDGDGYWVVDYADRVADSGSGEGALSVPEGMEGDCADDVSDLPEGSSTDPAEVHPDQPEICQEEGEEQLDDDCDGDAHTDASGDPPEGSSVYYADSDGDGYGDVEGATWRCEGGDGYASSFGDCDDDDSDAHPGAGERCDGVDEDCDTLVDEPEDLGDSSGCIDLYADRDGDGYGSNEDQVCLCYDGESEDACPEGYESYEGTCWTRTSGDCYDYDDGISPDFDEGGVVLDGDDNDCDSYVALVELDCDDDGALPSLPIEATGPVADAADVGLLRCDDPDAPIDATVACWGGVELRPLCDGTSGLWLVDISQSDVSAYFEGGHRVASGGGSCEPVGDCDDTCAARCDGEEERCDGIDNDCDAPAGEAEVDDDGIPDSMAGDVPGWISEDEADLDGDGFLACSNVVSGEQSVLSLAGCDTSPADDGLLDDCNDLCSLASPLVEEERCDGFTNRCGGEGESPDDDGDGHLSCGAWSEPEDERIGEDLYALVWFASVEDEASSLLPLVPPRAATPTCDAPLSEGQEGITGAALSDADPDAWLAGTLSACIAADVCAHDAGASWPGDCATYDGAGCALVTIELVPDAGTDTAGLEDARALRPGCEAEAGAETGRAVWSAARISAARALVSEWECYRRFGTWGCGGSGAPEGWVSRLGEDTRSDLSVEPLSPAADPASDPRWYYELGRYDLAVVREGLLAGCWGDAREDASARAVEVGGDCGDGTGAEHRERLEGPDDVLGRIQGETADCATCQDGLDNNCNGLADCADPACAVCYVGAGSGCGSVSPCATYACATSPARASDAGLTVPGAILGLLVSALRRRRDCPRR